MISEVAGYLLETMLAKLPGFLARHFFPIEKTSRRIDIDLRSNQPIKISLSTDIPYVDLYFRIVNHSPFDLTVDRLLIRFWIGQPIFSEAILIRHEINRNSSTDSIFFTCQLSSLQAKAIKIQVDGQLIKSMVSIEITAYFESKIGMLCIEKRIDRTDIPVNF